MEKGKISACRCLVYACAWWNYVSFILNQLLTLKEFTQEEQSFRSAVICRKGIATYIGIPPAHTISVWNSTLLARSTNHQRIVFQPNKVNCSAKVCSFPLLLFHLNSTTRANQCVIRTRSIGFASSLNLPQVSATKKWLQQKGYCVREELLCSRSLQPNTLFPLITIIPKRSTETQSPGWNRKKRSD